LGLGSLARLDSNVRVTLESRSRQGVRVRQAYPLVIVLACLAAYANIFDGSFVFDDVPSIVRNPHIRSLMPIAEAAGIGLKDDITIAGRPLPAFTFALNYAASGLDTWSFRATNLLIHIAAALLLFSIVRKTLRTTACAARFGSHADALALAVALLWSLHPLQPTSVTYVVQRVESLMGLFALLTLYATIRCAETARGYVWTTIALVACALGMASKEVMVVIPLLILLYDRTFLSGSFATALRTKTGLYSGLAATWLILGALVITSPRAGIAAGLTGALSPLEYLQIQAWAIPRYLRLCFWPSDLALDYGSTTIGVTLPLSMPVVAAGAALLVALAIGTLVALWRNKPIGFLGAWIFLILAPSSSIIPLPFEPAAEHRMYLPLAAVTALAVLGLFQAIGGLAARGRIGLAILLIAAGAFGARTFWRNALFRNEIRLWLADVHHNPANVRVQTNLALAYSKVGEPAKAIEHYRAALAIRPADPEALLGIGSALLMDSKFDESAAFSRRAIEANPKSAEALSNLGEALKYLDRPADAIPYFQKSIALNPENAATNAGLADALAGLGRFTEAVPYYRTALAANPDDVPAHVSLARCLVALGRRTMAIEQIQSALRRLPNDPDLRAELAALASEERTRKP
jgi:tetratricopeptide (TPR) repeat protein